MSKKISIGQISDFSTGKAKVIQAEGIAIVINRVDDKFYAVENRTAFEGGRARTAGLSQRRAINHGWHTAHL